MLVWPNSKSTTRRVLDSEAIFFFWAHLLFCIAHDQVIMGCIGSLIHFDPIDEKRIHDFDPQHCVIQLENGLLPASLRTLIAQFQVRRPEASGGLGITSMEAIQAPAFYSAILRFFRTEKMLTFFCRQSGCYIDFTFSTSYFVVPRREPSSRVPRYSLCSYGPECSARDRSPCLPDLKLVFSGADFKPVSRAAALAFRGAHCCM